MCNTLYAHVISFKESVTCHQAVLALIISRLDYCNGLFTVLSAKDKKKLESIQNRAARLVFAYWMQITCHAPPH